MQFHVAKRSGGGEASCFSGAFSASCGPLAGPLPSQKPRGFPWRALACASQDRKTTSVCPCNGRPICAPVCASQNRTVLSRDADATCCPFLTDCNCKHSIKLPIDIFFLFCPNANIPNADDAVKRPRKKYFSIHSE